MSKAPLLLISSVLLSLNAAIATSQNASELRSQSAFLLAELKQLGEPMDRCSLRATFGDGAIVIRTLRGSGLRPGDRIASINGEDINSTRSEDIVTILRKTRPEESLSFSYERDGTLQTSQLQCVNSRPHFEALVQALTFASKGKFEECVSVLGEYADTDTQMSVLKVHCAIVSRNSKKYDAAALAADSLRMQIEDAHWMPSARRDLVYRLRQSEGELTQGVGARAYQTLIEATRKWPGAESLYDSTEPDWAVLRRNAESALKSKLIDPESAQIDWPYGFRLGSWRPPFSKEYEGYWTCGNVNARNRMGGYTGSTAFVVVLDPNGVVKYSEIGSSKDFDMLSSQCERATSILPPPPKRLSAKPSAPPSTTSSLADELKKLADLKNSGALTEAEFQAAKARLLGTEGN